MNDVYRQVIFSMKFISQNYYNKLFGVKGSFESNRAENQWIGWSRITLSCKIHGFISFTLIGKGGETLIWFSLVIFNSVSKFWRGRRLTEADYIFILPSFHFVQVRWERDVELRRATLAGHLVYQVLIRTPKKRGCICCPSDIVYPETSFTDSRFHFLQRRKNWASVKKLKFFLLYKSSVQYEERK